MRIDVFTIFPEMVAGFAAESLLGRARPGRARTCGRTTCVTTPPTSTARSTTRPSAGARAWCSNPSRSIAAIDAADPPRPLFLLGPGGDRFDQARARALAGSGGFSLLCGRYEGVDQRVVDHCCDGELSIGDYVLAGGEVAAMVVIEAVGRLIPGVMGNEESAAEESFSSGLLEYPQYTRPARLDGRRRGRRGPRGAALGRSRPRRDGGVTPRPWPARPAGGPTCWSPDRWTPPTKRRWRSSACSTRCAGSSGDGRRVAADAPAAPTLSRSPARAHPRSPHAALQTDHPLHENRASP